MTFINRRKFLGRTAATGMATGLALAASTLRASTPSGKIVVGVMGMQRGKALAVGFARQPNVEVKYVCDLDESRARSGASAVVGVGRKTPKVIRDFREILDDKSVDALICAAPNHWHGPATILACSAGKNVYVEKPCSHNPHEGEVMVQAARKHNRCVQIGTQRRSGEGFRKAIDELRGGVIGEVYLARSWYYNARTAMGASTAPSNFDWDLWQGPAPRRSNVKNFVHYNWHWRWHWGNGELGNNGIHTLDLCRWGLGVEFPTRVVSSGGRYCFADAQETPDTQIVSFEFGDERSITWQGLSCNKNGSGFVAFYGTKGSLELGQDGSYTVKVTGQETRTVSGLARGDNEHIVNFVSAITNDDPMSLNAEIAIGHASTMMCHLGNIAQRTGNTIHCDVKTGRIQDDSKAQKLWKREYEPGWAPKV